MWGKIIWVLPYIGIDKKIIIADFEIHPYETMDLSELNWDDSKKLKQYVSSFRSTLFQSNQVPREIGGVWIIKYKDSIIIKERDIEKFPDIIKILILILSLHKVYDFINPHTSYWDVRIFDMYYIDLETMGCSKFGVVGMVENMCSTVPENINPLKNINFVALPFVAQNISSTLLMMPWSEVAFGNKKWEFDVTDIYEAILLKGDYYHRFLNIAEMYYYWLARQVDDFFYCAIIPALIETLYQITGRHKRRQAIEAANKIDDILNDNDKKKILFNQKEYNWWVIARSIHNIYDTRNTLLHEWKRAINWMIVSYKNVEIPVTILFRLIFKYSILRDLIDEGIVINNFFNGKIIFDPFLTWKLEIKWELNAPLSMDDEFLRLVDAVKMRKDNDL